MFSEFDMFRYFVYLDVIKNTLQNHRVPSSHSPLILYNADHTDYTQ